MIILGINETSHDASVSLIENGNILFAGHAERYSKIKNDWYVNQELINDALQYGKPDKIAYYEKPYLKKSRLFFGGSSDWRPRFDIEHVPRVSFKHHYSHAAAGYFTSNFDDAVIVVLDAIGEWNWAWLLMETLINILKKLMIIFQYLIDKNIIFTKA